ncbi:MAG TPA: hypothetical protein VGO71_15155 [Baekduia sp.]|jgi:pilus assembly protein CpaE|nr:hypothetical protein [Baekduia sp.]
MHRRREGGQASIELLGMVPICLVVAMGAGELLAAGVARTSAGGAAQAAAMALVQGGDPERAARAAAPGWATARVTVRVAGRRVRVRITPAGLLPGTATLLASESEADAGPAS